MAEAEKDHIICCGNCEYLERINGYWWCLFNPPVPILQANGEIESWYPEIQEPDERFCHNFILEK